MPERHVELDVKLSQVNMGLSYLLNYYSSSPSQDGRDKNAVKWTKYISN